VKGIGRGVIGLGLKPVIGVVDFVTRTAEGMRNTATYWEEKRRGRVRPPRYFGRDKVLELYSEPKALGQELLYTLELGKYRKEFYVHHIEEENTIIIVSDNHILSVNKLNVKQEEWHVKIKGE
jgi:vacuolar protein sorting-associated protein 13A/C